MKLRSKLLLSATCLLTISVAATATSAYAWFVSNRQAELKLIGADVKTNATNLYIGGTGTTDLKNGNTVGFDVYSQNNKKTEISAATQSTVVATDISGNGVSFFKPNLAPDFTNDNLKASSIVSVQNNNTDKKYYYHQFELTFTQSNVSVTTGVYLSKESTIKQTPVEGSSTTTNIEKAVRVAFLDPTKSGIDSLLLYWAPYETTAEGSNTLPATYLKGTSDTPVEMGKTTSSAVGPISDIKNGKYLDKTTFTEDINDASAASTKEGHKSKILKLTNGETQKVIVRVWFEGMDSDCTTAITNSTIDVNLKFNGVNMGI